MGCGLGLIKYLLFIFNFIFSLCGLAILVIGILMQINFNHYKEAIENNVTVPSLTFIVVGSIIFVIAFFGCCGAIRESHCMTITFASFLLTIFIVQVAIAIYAFVVFRESNLNVKTTYSEVFKHYWDSPTQQEIVDIIQSNLECCGINSPTDFESFSNKTIPWSCCNESKFSQCELIKSYQSGCASELKNFLVHAGKILGGIAIGIAAVELIGIIFALCLAQSIKNYERRGYRV
ncbi:23 kDa integral membrane protein-like [Vespa mandarinia]|uniref:23 kDa integral membrane protein-like n=1 Tax=Vespa mandarinia TaxID=7446 RepID=UPI00161BF4BC|nr:23 kDa integral membrane protein-like [Vespa mandarinia]